jgi:hypothetical protein
MDMGTWAVVLDALDDDGRTFLPALRLRDLGQQHQAPVPAVSASA